MALRSVVLLHACCTGSHSFFFIFLGDVAFSEYRVPLPFFFFNGVRGVRFPYGWCVFLFCFNFVIFKFDFDISLLFEI